MATSTNTPVQLIDQGSADAREGNVFLDLASYGSPIRLCLKPSVATVLAASIMRMAGEAIEQGNSACDIVQFPKKGVA